MACRLGNPKAVPLFTSLPNSSLELDMEALDRVLRADHVKNKPVVVISVVGPFRKGKSFLLNFFIRYFASQCRSNWLNSCDGSLDGFSWRAGCERETTGILLWSEVFVVSTNQGEVAVVLMDTQGTFDRESTMEESATIFALSTMLSSVQIYNLSQNIAEDDLQNLQQFSDYGRLVQKEISKSPFQKLLFLVRDWASSHQFSFGEEGGRQFLKKLLQITEKQPPELKRLRKEISSSFEAITCFLMPYPGNKVARSPEFKGLISDIESDITQHLEELVSAFLHPNTLQPKRVNGVDITCESLCTYVQIYAQAFKNGNLPRPMSIREATGVANNATALEDALEFYMRKMNQLRSGVVMLGPRRLYSAHRQHREAALQMFNAVAKLGGADLEHQYRQMLLQMVDKAFMKLMKSLKGQMMNSFGTFFFNVGLVVLLVAFQPASTLDIVVRSVSGLAGFGINVAMNNLAKRYGTATDTWP